VSFFHFFLMRLKIDSPHGTHSLFTTILMHSFNNIHNFWQSTSMGTTRSITRQLNLVFGDPSTSAQSVAFFPLPVTNFITFFVDVTDTFQVFSSPPTLMSQGPKVSSFRVTIVPIFTLDSTVCRFEFAINNWININCDSGGGFVAACVMKSCFWNVVVKTWSGHVDPSVFCDIRALSGQSNRDQRDGNENW